MEEPITVLNGTFHLYGILLAAAALLGVLVWALCFRKTFPKEQRPFAPSLALLVIPFGLLGARAVYCLCRFDLIGADLGGWSFVYKLWLGGYSIVGALLGAWLAFRVYAQKTGFSLNRLLDAAVPGGALVLCLARLAEYFTTQGRGFPLETLCFAPIGICNEWEEWNLAVFFLEALAALGIFLYGLIRLPKAGKGTTVRIALLLLCASQVLLESFREDDSIRFGFVRFNQIAAEAGILALLLSALFRAELKGSLALGRILGFASALCMLIAIEFALDKTEISNLLLYILMVFALIAQFLLTATAIQKAEFRENQPKSELN